MKNRLKLSRCRRARTFATLASIALFVIATGLHSHLNAEDALRDARTLTYRLAVFSHADKTQTPVQSFPSSQEFLGILARASAPAPSAVIRKPFAEHLGVEATIDGVRRIFIFPLPVPDGSGPYAFFAHPGNKGEIPQLVLGPEDARSLGLLLRSFK